jgi:uncharacterized protein YgiM (DUF1202 family)
MAEKKFVAGPGGGGVALRDGPGMTARPVLNLARGLRVEYLETWYGWGLIELPNGMSGWVPEAHLVRYIAPTINTSVVALAAIVPTTVVDPEVEPETVDVKKYTTVVWPTEGKLNLRAGPGLKHEVLTKLPQGDWVEVFQKAGDWAHVRCMTGEVGWTHTAYLTR